MTHHVHHLVEVAAARRAPGGSFPAKVAAAVTGRRAPVVAPTGPAAAHAGSPRPPARPAPGDADQPSGPPPLLLPDGLEDARPDSPLPLRRIAYLSRYGPDDPWELSVYVQGHRLRRLTRLPGAVPAPIAIGDAESVLAQIGWLVDPGWRSDLAAVLVHAGRLPLEVLSTAVHPCSPDPPPARPAPPTASRHAAATQPRRSPEAAALPLPAPSTDQELAPSMR